jgi:hypothetical protein
MLSRMSPRAHRWAAGAAALGLLLLAYLPLLQAIPNGSDHYFMIDVGETQIVLNVWGTLHATGYPLYILTAAPLVSGLRALGVDAAAAPALVSLVTMLAALGFIYALALRVTARPWLSGAAVVALGLTRTVWIHAEIAEVYALMLLLLAAMLWIALAPRRPETDERRLYLLALLGGLGVAHHRALAMAIPALLFAMGPVLASNPRALPKRLIVCLLLGLLGFVPYLWLPLRAQAGAAWVYGEPGALDGFLTQFLGREYTRFIAPPLSPDGLWANLQMVVQVIVTDLTLPGLLAGLAGLAAGLFSRKTRRAAITLLLLAGCAFAFHALAYTDVLSALILMITLPLALGWAMLGDALLNRIHQPALHAQPHPRPLSAPERADLQRQILPPLSSMERGLGGEVSFGDGGEVSSGDGGEVSFGDGGEVSFGDGGEVSFGDGGEVSFGDGGEVSFGDGGEVSSGDGGEVSFGDGGEASVGDGGEVRPVAGRGMRVAVSLAVAALFVLLSASLIGQNRPFIESLVTDPTGLHTIRMAHDAPPDSTLMIPWGPRYFAAGFARDVQGAFPADVTLVDHRADFAALVSGERPLVTPATTFYRQNADWWAEQTGGRTWLTAAGPGLVRIASAPELREPEPGRADELPASQNATLACRDSSLDLTVEWAAFAAPREDWSVFVHLLDGEGALLATGDQSAPVFGWRPLTTWAAGEVVRDVYTVPAVPGMAELAYGFYRQRPDGAFENAVTYRLPVDCEAAS